MILLAVLSYLEKCNGCLLRFHNNIIYIETDLGQVTQLFRVFEFECTFPMDSVLRVQIYDYDMLSADDLIGETMVDLENRLFSKHRATVGFPKSFDL